MSIVHTLLGARPSPRSDGVPWTGVIVQEAELEAGPFADLETLSFETPDPDPANPQSRNLTFESELTLAWYRLIFIDEDGDTSAPTEPVYDDGEAAAIDWQPSVGDVAALIRARTKVPGGGEAGTFNAETKPTANEAQALIRQAVRRVSSSVGMNPCNDDLKADARDMASIYAAMLIEQSYWPEQTRNDGSAFKSLKSLWDEGIKTLTEAVGEICGGSGGASAAGAAVLPMDSFPTGELIGRETAW